MIKLTARQKAASIRKAHPTFKTERTLGLTSRQYCALYDVRLGLLTGQFVHVRNCDKRIRVPNGFNMGVECLSQESNKDLDNPAQCGTVACIGGWMAFVLDPKSDPEDRTLFVRTNRSRLRSLFYPPSSKNWQRYTPRQAAKAIDAFMSGNTSNPWSAI